MGSLQIKRYGDRGILVSNLSATQRGDLESAIQAVAAPLLEEVFWGYEQILILLRRADDVTQFLAKLDSLSMDAVPADPVGVARSVTIKVRYNGPDLTTVAQAVDKSMDEVVRLHSSPEYTVRMMGFAPGFPYLDGLPEILHLPRRGSPRNYIRPGTVAIGGAHAGIYSVASPGGWHLLGETEMVLFNPDAARSEPLDAASIFALRPGDRVRFIPTEVSGC